MFSQGSFINCSGQLQTRDLGLSGKVALVTAASKGLGKATAVQFAREGANVAICARSSLIEQAATEIESETGQSVLAMRADVNQTASSKSHFV